MQRNSSFIKKGMSSFLIAAIATSSVSNLNTIIDGILMGRILGVDALAGINVSLPAINLVIAFTMFVVFGTKVLMSTTLGESNFEEANKVFTLSNIALLIEGIILMAFSSPISRFLTNVLCLDKSLREVSYQYVSTYYALCIFVMFYHNFSSCANILGTPRIATVGSIIILIVNISCDIFYVKFLNLGVSGASLATITAFAISFIILMIYIVFIKKRLSFNFSLSGLSSRLSKLLSKGVLGVAQSALALILIAIVNYFAQYAFGKDGMFIMSIALPLVGIGNIISDSIGTCFIAMGGLLVGQKDYIGLRMLFKRGMLIALTFVILFYIPTIVIPGKIAMLFGAKDVMLIDFARWGVPRVATLLFIVGLIVPLTYYYPTIGRNKVTYGIILSLLISVFGSMIVITLINKEWLWWAYPAATLITFFVDYVVLRLEVKAANNTIYKYSLVPKNKNYSVIFDGSIECSHN